MTTSDSCSSVCTWIGWMISPCDWQKIRRDLIQPDVSLRLTHLHMEATLQHLWETSPPVSLSFTSTMIYRFPYKTQTVTDNDWNSGLSSTERRVMNSRQCEDCMASIVRQTVLLFWFLWFSHLISIIDRMKNRFLWFEWSQLLDSRQLDVSVRSFTNSSKWLLNSDY